MKTENDLLIDFNRWFFVKALGNPAKGAVVFQEWKRQRIPRLKENPATLSKEEYESRLKQLKKEAPGYLHYLQTNEFPDLPSNLQPFPKN
ncbi:MAG: hypothetical protein V4662_24685 [Verrucomicrobiota bacterium]